MNESIQNIEVPHRNNYSDQSETIVSASAKLSIINKVSRADQY
jgi:hypothetical protein